MYLLNILLPFNKARIFSIQTCVSCRDCAANNTRGFRGSSTENTAKACGRVRDLALFTTHPKGSSTDPAGAPASLQYTASEAPEHVGLGLKIHHCLFHD